MNPPKAGANWFPPFAAGFTYPPYGVLPCEEAGGGGDRIIGTVETCWGTG